MMERSEYIKEFFKDKLCEGNHAILCHEIDDLTKELVIYFNKRIDERIKVIFNLKLEHCYCTTRKDKSEGCDHCQMCMGYNDMIEELDWAKEQIMKVMEK